MVNMKTITVQMPEETYQRIKAYLKRHQVRQKDLLVRLIEAALENDGCYAPWSTAPKEKKGERKI